MITVDIEQCSPEWFAMRAGTPSASNFDKIVTMKGEPSKQREKYMYQLAGERITGVKEEGYTNAAMQRGIDLEPEARSFYEMVNGIDVVQVGMCYKDESRLFSCSPDGLVGDAGGLEIKCPTLAVHVEYLLSGKLPATYFQQVHGSMMITGREWWDFVSYYPGMPPLTVRVERNDEFNRKLNYELIKFCKELDDIVAQLKKITEG